MTEKNYTSIVQKLQRTRQAIGRRLAFEGLVNLFACLAGFVFLLWLSVVLFWPGPAVRSSLLIAGLIGGLAWVGLAIVKPLMGRQPLTEIALRLERFFGKLQSRLIASLQLYDKLSSNKENYSIELIEKTIDEAGSEIRNLDFNVVIDRKRKPFRFLAAAIVMVILALFISGNAVKQAMMLYASPLTDIPRPTKLTLAVSPVDYQAIKNDDVLITITAGGEKVRQVNLNFQYEDGDWVAAAAERSTAEAGLSDTTFTYTFRKVKRDIQFFAATGNVRSPVGKITIIDPPRLVALSLNLEFPKYTRLPVRKLPENEGSVTAVKGTRIIFEGRLNKPAVAASFVFADGSRRPMSIAGDQISGNFALSGNGSYHIEAIDAESLKNSSPIEYDLVSLDDYPPQAQITFPAVDIDLDERMLVPLQAAVYDDFGFSKLDLVYWTFSEGRESSKKRLAIKSEFGEATEELVDFDWSVEDLNLLPGDLVYYHFEIFDNDAISGPKSSVSKTYSARLPSLDEIMADITGSQDEAIRDFEETVQSQKALRDELQNISREMANYSEVEWEKKQQIQGTLDRQKEIAEKIDQMAEQMNESIEKFEKNNLATMEMLDKMEEMRSLLEQVATPELKEAMRKLQEALQQMDPDKLREAMQNFQLSVDQVNENLDRMLALLKKYQLEQKLDTMAELAKKLAEQQQQINDKLGQCKSDSEVSDLQKPQEGQQQGLESLQEQMDQAKKLNDELKMLSEQDMQKADESVNSEQLEQMMSQMSQSLGMCNAKQASRTGQQIQQQFGEMAQMLQQMLQQMQSEQLAAIEAMIRKAIADILYISHQQEIAIDSTGQADKRLEGRRDMARLQKEIESATGRTSTKVSDITKETLFVGSAVMERLGNALQFMQEAIDRLSGRNLSPADKSQVAAMASLNQAAQILMQSLNQVSQCQSSGTGMQSLMQKLSQMAQQQQSLNQNSQMMLPMPGQMPGMMQQEALKRLAAEQESIRKSLQELTEEYGNSDNVLGRLGQLGEEMQKVAEEMRSQNFDRNTVLRQERILSRLLDAQRSANRRDYSRRRQARTGDDITRRGPERLELGDQNDEQLAEDIKKALSEKYPRRYENQIKEYFRALSEEGAVE